MSSVRRRRRASRRRDAETATAAAPVSAPGRKGAKKRPRDGQNEPKHPFSETAKKQTPSKAYPAAVAFFHGPGIANTRISLRKSLIGRQHRRPRIGFGCTVPESPPPGAANKTLSLRRWNKGERTRSS